MGEPIGALKEDHRPMMKSSACFEIVGVPGSGKTSLVRELVNRHNQFHLRLPPYWKQLRSFPFYLRNSLSLTAMFVALTFGRQGRWLVSHELSWLLLLNGWHRQLARLGPDSGIAILDQGPVYMLSMMMVHRDDAMARFPLGRWLKRISGQWASVLDGVIRLDSSDNVLALRINGREQNHIIKGTPSFQTRRFLERRRFALDQAIALLRAGNGRLAVLTFDTGRQSTAEIVAKVLGEFNLNEK